MEDEQRVSKRGRVAAIASGIVTHPSFEALFATLILFNALVMAMEVHYNGIDIGVELDYQRYDTPSKVAWPGASGVFKAFGMFFGVVFTLEIVLRVIGEGIRFPLQPWNWIDSTLVAFWLIEATAGNVINVSTQLLRLARLARLARLVRLVKAIKEFDALYLMTTALTGCLVSLGWACGLLFIFQMMLALLLSQSLAEYYFNDDSIPIEERREVFEYFGTFARAMLSMFEITLANWPPICRLLSENVTEWFMVFCIAHKLTIGFAVVGVINGVFMQETFKVAATDDVIMVRQKERAMLIHKKKMGLLFSHADPTKKGYVNREQFLEVIKEPGVSTWLASMELDAGDAETLFGLLDDGDGKLSSEELIRGVSKLRGAARSIDLATLMRDLRKLVISVSGVGQPVSDPTSPLYSIRTSLKLTKPVLPLTTEYAVD